MTQETQQLWKAYLCGYRIRRYTQDSVSHMLVGTKVDRRKQVSLDEAQEVAKLNHISL